MIQDLLRRVEQKDWTVIQEVVAAPPGIVEALWPLTANPDPKVREIALQCLREKGGEKVRDAFIQALRDKSEDIRDRALGFFHESHTPADLVVLLPHLNTHPDEFVREHVALIIGKIGRPEAIAGLEQAIEKGQPDRVSRAIHLALARLGQEKSREMIFSGLRATDVATRVQVLEEFIYIADAQTAGQLLPLLGDNRAAKKAGPGDTNYFIRVCDLTVNALDEVLQHPFPFPAGELRRYTDDELAAARRVLEKRIR